MKHQSGLSLPVSQPAFQYPSHCVRPRFSPEKKANMSRVENKKWNESEWFAEWLKLARKEGNEKVIA